MARTKRGYSYDFTPRGERDVHINLTRVPPMMHRNFKAKCREEGVSMRFQILRWIRNWLAGRQPDHDPPTPDRTNGPYEESGKIW